MNQYQMYFYTLKVFSPIYCSVVEEYCKVHISRQRDKILQYMLFSTNRMARVSLCGSHQKHLNVKAIYADN